MSQSFIQEPCSEFQPFVQLILFPSLARQKHVGITTHICFIMPFSLFSLFSVGWVRLNFIVLCLRDQGQVLKVEVLRHWIDF